MISGVAVGVQSLFASISRCRAGDVRVWKPRMTRQSIETAIKVFLLALVITFFWTCWKTLQLLGIF